MATRLIDLLHIIGLATWGDLGPLTVFKNKRHQLIWYAKAPPHKPATPAQQHWRDRWRAAATNWQKLTTAQKADWERAARRASLYVTGYNLYVHTHVTGRDETRRTIERQTGITLPM